MSSSGLGNSGIDFGSMNFVVIYSIAHLSLDCWYEHGTMEVKVTGVNVLQNNEISVTVKTYHGKTRKYNSTRISYSYSIKKTHESQRSDVHSIGSRCGI